MKETNKLKNNKNLTTLKGVENTRNLIKLSGITTSQVRKREKLSNTPAYCFLKTDNREQDIPTIFRIKKGSQWIKPIIPKGSYLEVEGKWTEPKNHPFNCLMRKSFTAISYQLLNSEQTEILSYDKETLRIYW